jgi:hydroxylamine reductase (hybrid-cluster protein)
MKEVRKKSADATVNQMIAKAYCEQVSLPWDRAEALQPQCGFGRMAICCTDCLEGPCRTNPFAETAQYTICGREAKSLVTAQLLRKASDGATALAKLAAEYGCKADASPWPAIALTADSMIAYPEHFAKLGKATAAALGGIAAQSKSGRKPTAAGMGVLETTKPNIVCHGHVPPKVIAALAKAAAETANVVGICGSEKALPVATNYDSQEAAVLTGLVDLLVVGSQCVTPALLALAARLSVPVIPAATLGAQRELQEAVAAAQNSFKRREGKAASVQAAAKESYVGYDTISPAKGLAYLGGCGNVAQTQDAQIVRVASYLVDNGYTVITAGCAGTALAKAGMCDGKAVVNLGSCHDAGEFLALAAKAQAGGVPVFAVMLELTHNKTLATAVALAARGIPTLTDLGEIRETGDMLEGKLRPIGDLQKLPEVLAELTPGH